MIGRKEELDKVKSLLSRTGVSSRVAIIGERGIGKSTFLEEIKKYVDEENHISAFASIDPSLNLNTFASRLYLSFTTNAIRTMGASAKEKAKKFKRIPVPFVGSMELREDEKIGGALDNFCFHLTNEFSQDALKMPDAKRAYKQRKVTLFIDEIDTANNSILPIGACLKTIIEYLDFHNTPNVNIIIAGLPRSRSVIYKTHPSAWREFENINLRPFSMGKDSPSILESDSAKFANSVLSDYSKEGSHNVHSISTDAMKRLINLSNGYPHWIRAFVRNAANFSSQLNSERLSIHHLSLGMPAAFQTVWEDYYSADFEDLDESAQLLLRLIASHGRPKVRVDRIKSFYNLNDTDLSKELKLLVEKDIVDVSDEGIYQFVEMRSTAYRHRLSQMVHPLLDPLGLVDFWHSADAKLSNINVFGEKGNPSFKIFSKMIGQQFDADSKINFFEYDSTVNLFDSIDEPKEVDSFRSATKEIISKNHLEATVPPVPRGQLLNSSNYYMPGNRVGETRDGRTNLLTPCSENLRFSQVWKEADLLCIPHYMLGKAASLGLWTFEELFDDRYQSLQKYFNYILHDFEESCTFEGHWVAAPFTYLTKVLVSKSDIETPKNWDELADEDGNISVVVDSIPNSIVLWYEWRQHLVENEDWPIFDVSRRSDALPLIGVDAKNAAICCQENSYKTKHQDKVYSYDLLFNSLNRFRKLLVSSDAKSSYWADYSKFLDSEDSDFKDKEYMSMWIEWATELTKVGNNKGAQLHWYDLPSLPGKTKFKYASEKKSQPLESWVFVIPRKESSPLHKERAKNIADLLMSTLSMGWQAQFQEAGGASPVAWLVNSTGSKYSGVANSFTENLNLVEEQPWNIAVASAIESRHERGKSRKEVDFIKAEVAFLTSLYFGKDGQILDELKDDAKFEKRFRLIFPEYISTLAKMVEEPY